MITSRITRSARTTVPEAVRKALQLEDGDALAYEIEDRQVILTKASIAADAVHETIDDPFSTFDEWAGDADRKAYGRL